MPSDLPLDEAYLTAIWLETLLYGINVSLFCMYLYVARYQRRTPRLNRPLLFCAIAMIVFSTVHVSLGFRRLLEGFIYLGGGAEPNGPSAYFSNVSLPVNVAKVVVHTVNSIVGDGIVVWRCYHVWSQKIWVCIFPVLLIMGSAACGFGQGIMFATATNAHSAFATEIERWNAALFAMSLITNVLVTFLIAGRVWYQARKTEAAFAFTSFKYRRVLYVIIESGMIYSSVLVIEIVLYVLGDNAFYIVYDPIAQLTGMVPTMIIIMASLGITSGKVASPSDETNTIASISVPDLNSVHDLSTGHGIDIAIAANGSDHRSHHSHHSHHSYHDYNHTHKPRRPRPSPLPLALEMKRRSSTMKGNDISRMSDVADYYMSSPTSPTSPMSSKTVVGSYSATGSWTSYTGHLKGKESREFHDRSFSGSMKEYGYPGFGTVAEAEYGDGETKGRPGLDVFRTGGDMLHRRDSESASIGDAEKGRAL